MDVLFSFIAPTTQCGYLPDQQWSLRYDVVRETTVEEYHKRLETGWRRFGFAIFRPECANCSQCRSLRVDATGFRPNRSQKRCWKTNKDRLRIQIGTPTVSQEKLDLYDRYHATQTEDVGWPRRTRETIVSYIESFVENPFPTEEWCYFLDNKLVGVGYVDRFTQGLSGIYFYYDPSWKPDSPGTFNVLTLLEHARIHKLPHVYLGYFVPGCRSLEYKANFRPCETFDWRTLQWNQH